MTRGNDDLTEDVGHMTGARIVAYAALAGTAAAGAAIALRRRRALREAALAGGPEVGTELPDDTGLPADTGAMADPGAMADSGAMADTRAMASAKPYPGSPLDDGDQLGRAGLA